MESMSVVLALDAMLLAAASHLSPPIRRSLSHANLDIFHTMRKSLRESRPSRELQFQLATHTLGNE